MHHDIAYSSGYGTKLGMLGFDAYGDDLENGEEDRGRCHGWWGLQHGRDIRGYLGRGDHPVKGIVARAASDGLESHEEHHSTVQHSIFCVIQSSAASPMKISGMSKWDL